MTTWMQTWGYSYESESWPLLYRRRIVGQYQAIPTASRKAHLSYHPDWYCLCSVGSWFMHSPWKPYLNTVDWILRYMKSEPWKGLHYTKHNYRSRLGRLQDWQKVHYRIYIYIYGKVRSNMWLLNQVLKQNTEVWPMEHKKLYGWDLYWRILT